MLRDRGIRIAFAFLLLAAIAGQACADGIWYHTHDDCARHAHPDVTDDPATWDHVSEPCHDVRGPVHEPPPEDPTGRDAFPDPEPEPRRLRSWRYAL